MRPLQQLCPVHADPSLWPQAWRGALDHLQGPAQERSAGSTRSAGIEDMLATVVQDGDSHQDDIQGKIQADLPHQARSPKRSSGVSGSLGPKISHHIKTRSGSWVYTNPIRASLRKRSTPCMVDQKITCLSVCCILIDLQVLLPYSGAESRRQRHGAICDLTRPMTDPPSTFCNPRTNATEAKCLCICVFC